MQSADVDLDSKKVAIAKRPKAKKLIKTQPYLNNLPINQRAPKTLVIYLNYHIGIFFWFWAKQTLYKPNFQARHIRKP